MPWNRIKVFSQIYLSSEILLSFNILIFCINQTIRKNNAQSRTQSSNKYLKCSVLRKQLRLTTVNYFRKRLHLKSWTGFWKHLWCFREKTQLKALEIFLNLTNRIKSN